MREVEYLISLSCSFAGQLREEPADWTVRRGAQRCSPVQEGWRAMDCDR